MSHIFAYLLKLKNSSPIVLISTCMLFISCNNHSIKKKLDIECNESANFEKLIKVKDAKGTFESETPSNWKRELFINNNESRLYAADTTKNLNNAYIYDLGCYSGELIIDNSFEDKIKNEISTTEDSEITRSKKINYLEKEAYYIHYKTTSTHISSKSIILYLKNKNNSFYKLKIDAYGEDNTNERFCEALDIFGKTIFNQ